MRTALAPGWLFAALAALALSGCGKGAEPFAGESGNAPILYEVSDAQGNPQGWLFGTIHSLPGGVKWRTETLDTAVESADLLVVEIANLGDNAALAKVFSELAGSPDQPDIAMRVSPEHRPALFTLIERSGYRPADFSEIETWAAALMLAQTDNDGSSRNGADRTLLDDFAGRPIRELEGAALQLGIFDSLPPSDQADLLEGVISEAGKRASDPERLRRAWLAGDETVLVEATKDGILADPELHEALLVGRNRRWAAQLDAMFQQPAMPFVAVGAAHLVGPDGLAVMLEQRGYTVQRVQ